MSRKVFSSQPAALRYTFPEKNPNDELKLKQFKFEAETFEIHILHLHSLEDKLQRLRLEIENYLISSTNENSFRSTGAETPQDGSPNH